MPELLKILILEDSATDAEILQRFLVRKQMQCEFNIASNKETFLLSLQQFCPDIILSDHSLPQFDSFEALKSCREIIPGIPFILVTGTVSEEFAADIIKLGADDYILKDRLEKLPTAILTTLQKRKLEKEKKEIEQEREFDRNNLNALINNTNDLMWSIDTSFNLITSNHAFDNLAIAMSGKTITKGSFILSNEFNEEQVSRFHKYYERAFSGESFTEIEQTNFPEFISEISFYPIRNKESVIGAACFSRDITQKIKAEADLKILEQKIMEQKIEEQKRIARAIIIGQEKERNHIGQELHDNITQILASTKLYLSIAEQKNADLKELIKYPMELITNSIEEIRLLCSKLVTPLKDINLEELIRDLLNKLDQTKMIKTEFSYSVPDKLISDDLKLNIYRTIQEQLNNILKHANAKNVKIFVQTSDKSIFINVTDDGKGFNINDKRKGIGISNMRNRIETFNGKINIQTSIGNGCTITTEIPI